MARNRRDRGRRRNHDAPVKTARRASPLFDDITIVPPDLFTESTGLDFDGPKSGDPVPPFFTSGKKQPLPSVQRVKQWREDFVALTNYFPEVFDDAIDLSGDLIFEFTDIFADGTFIGQCREGANTFDVAVSAGNKTNKRKVACSCPESEGQFCCRHNFNFAIRIGQELGNQESGLYRRVESSRFSGMRPSPQDLDFSEAAEIEHALAKLDIDLALDSDDGSLPPLKKVSQSRIVWDLQAQQGRSTLVPILQTAKKRGNGWTKGRKVSLADLAEHSACFSDADSRIKELIRFNSSYYNVTMTLSLLEAILQLVGEPNVLLNGQPAEVSRFEATFAFRKDDHHCWLDMVGSKAGFNMLIRDDTTLILARTDINTIRICEMQSAQMEAVAAIIALPRIPVKFEQKLLQRVAPLRKVINIEIPAEVAGKVTDVPCRPVVLLRSHFSGALDYGVRVRDPLQKLHRPGSGLMLQPGTVDGQPVQWKRSVEVENHEANQVLQSLGQKSGNWDGSIDDFEDALHLIGCLQDLEASGVEVLWDESSDKPLRMLGSITAKNVSVGINRKRDWFQLSGTCELKDESVDLVDLLGALQETDESAIRGDFVRIGDKGWTKIEKSLRDQLTGLRDSISQDRRSMKFDATSAPAIRELIGSEVQVDATQAWHQCLKRLDRAEKLDPVLPDSLNATLRDYQTEGFRWLRRLAEWGVGGILADDMGLGKTLQTLAVLLDRREEGPMLVIAPTSVGFNWVREAQRFAPDLDVHLYRETDRSDFLPSVGPGSLVICSYGLALRDATALASVDWSTMVLDEAQAVKNSRSKTSLAIASIPAQWKLALTGTPVENHLGELWSLFNVISPGVFGGWEQFRKRFAAPIEKKNSEARRYALRDRLQPFVLRRTKSEVLKDLPPRSEMNLYVELSDSERRMYDKVRMSAIGEIDEIAKVGAVSDQRFKILALLTRLRQIACSPRMVDENLTERSSKLQLLFETVAELKEEGHRVLIFSQFVKHLTLIREMFDAEGISYEYLDGQTAAEERQVRVDRFQNGDATAFLISLKAGGTGLNLTAADYVIHMDPWWNPAVEDQATDRAHRMGQEKPVMVYRLISQGTIEEEILKLHDTKRDLVAGVMEGTAAAAKMTTEDLMDLVRGGPRK